MEIIYVGDISVEPDAHTGTNADVASQLELLVSTLNTTVDNYEANETDESSTGLSPCNGNNWNTCCWMKWNLFLLHGSSKHAQAAFTQTTPSSG